MVQDAPSRTHPVITLDGLAGSGKSTLARRLAATLGWTYLDSGAWYRALTWAVLARGGDPAAADACAATLSDLTLASTPDGEVLVDGHAPGEALRTPAIDAAVGLVADHKFLGSRRAEEETDIVMQVRRDAPSRRDLVDIEVEN
ncbi:MAG: (d)CMP kinase, partial [Planctomycetota bacterium]